MNEVNLSFNAKLPVALMFERSECARLCLRATYMMFAKQISSGARAFANQPERLKDMSRSAALSSRSDEACGLRPPRCKAEAATGRGSGAPGQGAPDTHSNLIGFAIILFWILYPLIKHL